MLNIKQVFIICLCVASVVTPFLLYCCIKICNSKKTKIDYKTASDIKALKKKVQQANQTSLQVEPLSKEFEDTLKKLSDIEEQVAKAVDAAKARRERHHSVQNKTTSLCRVMSCFCYWSSWGWIIYLIHSHHLNLPEYEELFSTLDNLSVNFLIIMIAIVFVESFSCSEFQMLRNISSVCSATERIKLIRTSRPSIVMSAVCYHYETRTRYVDYHDSYGHKKKRLENYQEKVVTAVVKQPYIFSFWQDLSPKTLMDVDKQKVTKIKMQLYVLFGDTDTATNFHDRYSRFQDKNRPRDTFVDFAVNCEVAGFEKCFVGHTSVKKKPFWIGLPYYIISTLLYLGWIYRIIFNKVAGRTKYKVVKLIHFNRPSGKNLIAPNEYDAEKLIGRNNDESNAPPPSYDSLINVTRNNITLLLTELQMIARNNDDVNNEETELTSLKLVSDIKNMHFLLGQGSKLHQVV